MTCLLQLEITTYIVMEPLFDQLGSHSISTRQARFMKEVRARDGKCVISSLEMPEDLIEIEEWGAFEAAHIFPVQWESLWVRFGFSRYITDMEDDNTRSTKIHSCQNGFLLNKIAHSMFDRYILSINVNDGYKVVVFGTDPLGYDGRILDPLCRNRDDPHRVSDDLLKWHFQQFVFRNMRGAAEPNFEEDFLPEPDKVHDILTVENQPMCEPSRSEYGGEGDYFMCEKYDVRFLSAEGIAGEDDRKHFYCGKGRV
ncbi:hypothetical protein HOY82DRAFT_541163 [Tuber indicum]|nr:hypothetical protein HOY82DRAFT_541163 [Tuber indicum]